MSQRHILSVNRIALYFFTVFCAQFFFLHKFYYYQKRGKVQNYYINFRGGGVSNPRHIKRNSTHIHQVIRPQAFLQTQNDSFIFSPFSCLSSKNAMILLNQIISLSTPLIICLSCFLTLMFTFLGELIHKFFFFFFC